MELSFETKIRIIDAEIEQLEEGKFTMSVRMKTNKLLKRKAQREAAAAAYAEFETAIELLEEQKQELMKEQEKIDVEEKKEND